MAQIVIVDTTVWIDYFGGTINAETQWLDAYVDTGLIGLTDLILCEYLQGVRLEKEVGHVLKRLSQFQMFSTGGSEIAVEAARNYRFLRRKGITVRATVDCLVASFCMKEGLALLHRDRDYGAFEQHLGLEVIHPIPLRIN
jgi:predicted nucleic acid-binding protein